jgi:hypothetical protein
MLRCSFILVCRCHRSTGSTILCLLLVCSWALLVLWQKVQASKAGAGTDIDSAGLAKLKTAPGADSGASAAPVGTATAHWIGHSTVPSARMNLT